MLTDIENRKTRKPNFRVSVNNSWLGRWYVKITLDEDEGKIEQSIEEIRELLNGSGNGIGAPPPHKYGSNRKQSGTGGKRNR